MTRVPLPSRRPNATSTIWHGAHQFTVTVGFGPDGTPKEVFADGPKSGTDLRHLLADACVWASLLLQFGATTDDLRRSLGRVPVTLREGDEAMAAASLLGAIADLIAEETPAVEQ